MILVGVIGLGSLFGPGFILWLILLPGWPLYFLVGADPISVWQMGMISGAAWFVIGAVIPSITQNRWKSVVLWMGLALISNALAIILVVSNLSKIGP